MIKFIVEVVTSAVILLLVMIGVAVVNANGNVLTVLWLLGIVGIIQLLHALFWQSRKRSESHRK